ncbi:hypothetical protein V1477_021036 [Vespula maculifrons]|uniref:Uncharacterized protein n=1 Tax=Vespula maculifrons TaxID=7453 RepID=A0ABD2AGY5_VESMC
MIKSARTIKRFIVFRYNSVSAGTLLNYAFNIQDLGQLICWFARILLLTIEEKETFINSRVYIYETVVVPVQQLHSPHADHPACYAIFMLVARRNRKINIPCIESIFRRRRRYVAHADTIKNSACSVAKVSAHSDCGEWGMKTSYQRTSGKTVGHSFGSCGTSNTPDSALLYIFSTFIHHTSQRAIFIAKDPNLAISEFETYLNWHLLFFRTSEDTSYVDSTNVRPSTGLREDVLFEIESQILRMHIGRWKQKIVSRNNSQAALYEDENEIVTKGLSECRPTVHANRGHGGIFAIMREYFFVENNISALMVPTSTIKRIQRSQIGRMKMNNNIDNVLGHRTHIGNDKENIRAINNDSEKEDLCVNVAVEEEEKGDTGDEAVVCEGKDYAFTLVYDSMDNRFYLDADHSANKFKSN